MKLTATITVEFEMEDGEPADAASAVLARGLSVLRLGIERNGIGSTGIKRDSLKVEISRKELTSSPILDGSKSDRKLRSHRRSRGRPRLPL